MTRPPSARSTDRCGRTLAATTPLLLALACASPRGPVSATAATADHTAIRALIATHYVTAVFETRDEPSVRRAFHPEFQLFVLDDDDGLLIVAPLEMWLERLSLDGVRSASEVRHDVAFIDVTGHAAVARTELYEDGEHIYTDYFSLYRFPDRGWQIVTKIFESHD